MNWQRVFFRSASSFIFILSSIILYPDFVFPQSDGNGTISGFIFNSTQQPLAGVEVRAVATSGTYFYWSTYSDQNGSYSINNLPVGQYYVRIQNKLGYLNTYYSNVLDKSDAKLIKLNSSQHVRNINFYLARGGFIRGQIFDDKGNKITSSASVGFSDAIDFNSRGFINSNPDGSYISPALPNGPHIVKASSIPGGYVMTYFNNATTQYSAQSLFVTIGDTIKNIDFYLQKGGAISGRVSADDLNQMPILDALIVVSDWTSGEWSSECRTDANGYYCAQGLRPGEYRVYVHSVDPAKYHTEYFDNASHYDSATKVYVADRDTIPDIDFKLQTVKQLTLGNAYIEICVSDRYPGTNLTMEITRGLPETSLDDGKPILFGHPHPYTSFTTLWIDGKEIIYGSEDGNLQIDPYTTRDQKSISRTWRIGKLEVEQKISLVVSEWSETKYEDTAQLQYIVKNTDSENHKVGLRILLDTMLGKDDAAPIRTSNSTYSETEREFLAPNIPKWWAAIEGYNNITMFSVQGTLSGYGAKPPDRFSIVNWSNIFKTKWDYKTNGNLGIINDSGVAMRWEPAIIEPGKVAIYCTFLGLGAMYPDKMPPYTNNHIPARWDSSVAPGTNIQLDLLDDYMGVDSSTIAMWINSIQVTPKISGDVNKFTLVYDPKDDFHFNDTVNVVVTASDLAFQPNDMEPDDYDFYIEQDNSAPYILDLYPQPFAENVPPDTCLSFALIDDHSGIDTSSIQIFFNEKLIPYSMAGENKHLKIEYDFNPPFGERDSVSVRISAHDLVVPANKLDYTFYFHVMRDSIAPWVEFHYPLDRATEVPLDTNVVIDIVDDFSGIDRNSIILLKNNQPVTPKIAGDSTKYRLIYKPEGSFLYNDTIKMNLNVNDLAKKANSLKNFEFTFFAETDKAAPEIVHLRPAPDDTNAAPTPTITMEIKDEKSGVDTSSIIIKINNEPAKFVIKGDKNHYYLSYKCTKTYEYLEWINIAVAVQDQSNPPNRTDTLEYAFRIIREKDVTPPDTRLHSPAKGDTNVSPISDISFHIYDDLSGVDINSIKLRVNNDQVKPTVTGYPHDYTVYYDPPLDFWYGDSVNIKIDARDLATDTANTMATVEYSFKILQDRIKPEIIWRAPGLPNSHIPLDAVFIVDLVDSLTGVDINSIVFKFDGAVKTPEILGNPKTYTLKYKPEQSFNYNQVVQINITVSDLATEPNSIEDAPFNFYTTEDHEPPYISSRNPEKDMSNVPFETDIELSLNDDIAGVDITSITLTVEGAAVVPEIIGTPASYLVRFKNPKEFEAAQNVDVVVACSDRSNPPQSMSEHYSFTIKEVYPDLDIMSFVAEPPKVLVNKPVLIKAIIRNSVVAVHKPIKIRLSDGNKVLFDSTLSPLGVDEKHDVIRTIIFDTEGRHKLILIVDPENEIQESNKENNSDTIYVEVTEGEMTVRSNPFTPNGDGINDIVTFNFEQLGVADPQLRLYDVSGRMIITLQERTGFTFVWNGTDRFGNQALPGVYLYLLQDQNQVIANGYVVLAR